MVQTPDQPEIRHKKWRHKTLNYEVKVLAVYNNGHPNYRTVKVDRSKHALKPRTWSAVRFVVEFEPIGRPQRRKTLLQSL